MATFLSEKFCGEIVVGFLFLYEFLVYSSKVKI